MNLFKLLQDFLTKGLSPQQIVMKALDYVGNKFPMLNNLVNMANNNPEQVTQFARNVFNERGLDFDKEFSDFKSKFNIR